MTDSRLLRDLLTLLRIASPSRREGAIASHLAHEFSSLGLEVSFDDAGKAIGGESGNLFAVLPANDSSLPNILLSAHMDTVQGDDQVEPQIVDGRVVSSGKTVLGADDKAGIVVILETVRRVVEGGLPHGRVEVLISVAEEIGLLGAKHADTGRVTASIGYILDSEGPVGKITVRAPYQDSIRVTFHGKRAHAGVRPEEGRNAIVAASRAIASMTLGRLDEETTANVGVIQGGQASNIIPDVVEVKAEARSLVEEKLKAQTASMLTACEQGAQAAGCTVDVKPVREYEGFSLGPEDAPVSRAVRAAERIGITPELVSTGGGSDTNIYNARGLSSVGLGVGYINSHSHEEAVSLTDLEDAVRLVVELLTVP